ncbi:MAG: endonuclease/exonuclease/phosphatase family protein [Chthoniobacterales bacterium]
MRVATYNVHGCVGLDRRRSETRIAEVIADLSLDLIGLQELDLGRKRSAGAEQARLIAEQLGWHHLFQPAMRRADEQYGNAIISRYPLTLRAAIVLPGEGSWYCRETRVALWASAQTPAGPVHVGNTHFGLGRAERFLQARALTDFVSAQPAAEPLLLLGDFNSRRRSRALDLLRTKLRDLRTLLPAAGPCRTFPTRWPTLAVDHIFVNAALRPVSISVARSSLARVASDHFPLVAELAL